MNSCSLGRPCSDFSRFAKLLQVITCSVAVVREGAKEDEVQKAPRENIPGVPDWLSQKRIDTERTSSLSISSCVLTGLSNQDTASLKCQPQKRAQSKLLGYKNLYTTPIMILGLFFFLLQKWHTDRSLSWSKSKKALFLSLATSHDWNYIKVHFEMQRILISLSSEAGPCCYVTVFCDKRSLRVIYPK